MNTKDTERLRDRDTDDTHDTNEAPPPAACFHTLQEAVNVSLVKPLHENTLFDFARCLKAFEITTGKRLSRPDRKCAFVLWWTTAKQQLPTDADQEEWWFDFEDRFLKTKSAWGSNALEIAIVLADKEAPPSDAVRFSPKFTRLISVCFHLQKLQGKGSFFITYRAAADLLGVESPQRAQSIMNGLVSEGLFLLVQKGNRFKATRYRYLGQLAPKLPTTVNRPL